MNVGAIEQHDFAQAVRQQHRIETPGFDWKRFSIILADFPNPLKHAAIDGDTLACRFEKKP